MSNESGAQLAELRDLAHHSIGQLNRAALGWINIVRKMLDATETNVAAFCDHASKMAQAGSPAECVKLQAEFFRSSIAAMHKQSTDMVRIDAQAAAE